MFIKVLSTRHTRMGTLQRGMVYAISDSDIDKIAALKTLLKSKNPGVMEIDKDEFDEAWGRGSDDDVADDDAAAAGADDDATDDDAAAAGADDDVADDDAAAAGADDGAADDDAAAAGADDVKPARRGRAAKK